MSGDNGRTRAIVLTVCAAAIIALFLIALYRLSRTEDPWLTATDTPPPRERVQAPQPGAAEPAPPAAISDGPSASAPRGNPAQFFGPDAYPPDALRAGEQGRTVARLTVDVRGIPTGCDIVTSSGSRRLDAATCAIAIGRVRYQPARDAAGQAIASRATLPVRWMLPQ